MARSSKIIVPQSRATLNQMKYEIASELGLTDTYSMPSNGMQDTEFASELGTAGATGNGKLNWSVMKSREAGSVGGLMTKRLVELAEQQLNQL
ncbi:small, acid-soluble spore protein, alpha/beta type [Paenibacillus yanchengensis]|uniref:Small, acid-soluble spore protein, alpha/beta type n=1 Tax=Paenibacillus yanchengensis TaxID=2035833 RepID=A0ABW4YMN6_9BACL